MAAWTVAVILAGSVAWRAVTVVDTDSSSAVLSQAEVSAELVAARATASLRPTPGEPTPTGSPTPSESPPPTAGPEPTASPEPTAEPEPEVVRSWSVAGGTVAASCRGAAITLLYATPLDGWRVEVKDQGPERIEVELEGHDQEVTLRAACVAGTPEQQTSDRDQSENEDEHD